MSKAVKVTLFADAIKYNESTNTYSLLFNNINLLQYTNNKTDNTSFSKIIFEIAAEKIDSMPNLSEIDSILDEVDSKSNVNKQQQSQPSPKRLDLHKLHIALQKGDTQFVKDCIVNGLIPNVNAKLIPQTGYANNTMLATAVWHGSYEIAAMLINLGATHVGTQSLWWSVSRQHYHIERLLIMSKFGGSASRGISDRINKMKFAAAFCNELISDQNLNDDWFTELTKYQCSLLSARKAFSDDFLMLCWYYAAYKYPADPFQSELWRCLMAVCSDIIQSKSKRGWYFLKEYILPSAIWLQILPSTKQKLAEQEAKKKKKTGGSWKVVGDESDINRMTINDLLYIELYKIATRRAKIEGRKLKSIETENVSAWHKLCSYDVDTRYDKKVVRQDEIANGIQAIKSKQELMSEITPTYNPILFYDVEQYLPSLISVAYNVNDRFQDSIQEIYDIDHVTNQSKLIAGAVVIGTKYKRGPIKLIERCRAKVVNEYFTECEFPSAAHLLDINRCLLTFENVSSMLEGLHLFYAAVQNKKSGVIKEIVLIKFLITKITYK